MESLYVRFDRLAFELEMDVGRFGAFGAVLLIEAHGFRILGDRTIEMTDSETISDGLDPVLGVETYTANWKFRADTWMYRAGVGIRFQWLGDTGP